MALIFLTVTEDNIEDCTPDSITDCAICRALDDNGHRIIAVTHKYVKFDSKRFYCSDGVKNWQLNLKHRMAEPIELVFDEALEQVMLFHEYSAGLIVL